MDNLQSRIDAARYALAKQVPDMDRGFIIGTSYGDLDISQDEAKQIQDAVRKVLQRRLAVLEKQAGDRS